MSYKVIALFPVMFWESLSTYSTKIHVIALSKLCQSSNACNSTCRNDSKILLQNYPSLTFLLNNQTKFYFWQHTKLLILDNLVWCIKCHKKSKNLPFVWTCPTCLLGQNVSWKMSVMSHASDFLIGKITQKYEGFC